MLPAHWKTLQPLLDQVLDTPPAERAALLQRWRTEHPTLIEPLEQLLHKHDSNAADGFLGDAVLGQDAAAGGLFGTTLAGQRLGAWVLQQPIGEGGMGSVWLARRDDGRFAGEAAVKLLSHSMAGAGRAERFRREGHILAKLAHPHIARLLDAGVSPSGQPYLVLEHVRGQHIDQHCDSQRLGLRARIGLFLTLLQAVQHAHGQLVVHRDIKPSNVMVDNAGQPKLLDFGIAKLLALDGSTDAPLDATTQPTPLTQQAGALLTPGHAAPEQLQAGTVSTATDVYALGVLLYQLLSGHHPTLRPGSTALQAMRDTLEREPPLMSQAVHGSDAAAASAAAAARGLRPTALQRALAGDLDTIVAKALRRAPTERYATAAALADDLQRHLQQLPVQARRPGLAYLLRRFVQRHRLPLAATLAGTLVLAGVGVQAWQARQAARLSQAQAQSVDGLLQSLFHGMGPDVAASRSFSAAELLDRGQAFLDSQPGLDPATRRATRLRMAALYRDVGAYAKAAAAFDAEADAARQAGQRDARMLALWNQANMTVKLLDAKRAAAQLQALAAELQAGPPAGPVMQGRMALLQGELALIGRRTGEAEAALAQAEALLASTSDLELTARAAQGQGATARLAGDIAAARQHYQRSAALHARRGADAVLDRLTAMLDLAGVENAAGQHAAAAALLGPVHAELLARLGPQHALTVSAVSDLALAELRQGHRDALAAWLTALRVPDGAGDAWRNDHADTLAAMAQLYSGQAAAAEPALRRLLAALERDEGGITPATEPVRRLHAEALLRLGRTAEAEAELLRTQANQLGYSRADHPGIASTRVLLGIACARRGDMASARQHWDHAATVLAHAFGHTHPHAVAAASYAALARPAGGVDTTVRQTLADTLHQRLGWQAGAAMLVAALRQSAGSPDWPRLPAVL